LRTTSFLLLKKKKKKRVRYIFQGLITCVAWNPECIKDGETGSILLGTSQGQECFSKVFYRVDGFLFRSDRINLPPDELPFNKVAYFRWLMLVCQPGRLYSVCASIDMTPPSKSSYMSAANLQTGWITIPEIPPHIFHPFFSTKGRGLQQTSVVSALLLYPPHGEPNRFLWVGPSGITTGKVNLFADKPRDIIEEDDHMDHRRMEGRLDFPIGASLSEYHILLAYPSRLNALSVYTKTVVYEDVWGEDMGNAVGLVSDPTSEFHWLYTSHITMKYKPVDENRYVWRVFLERGDYAKALTIAKSRLHIDPEAHELVLKRQADKYIAEKNFTAAAEILAQSTESFEAVVLKFMSTDEAHRLGLKTLLEKKLDSMTRPEDRIRRDVLIIWLLEVQLAELAEARRDGREQESNELAVHLQRFLMRKNVHDTVVVNKDAVYNLMASHADIDSQLFIAKQIGGTDSLFVFSFTIRFALVLFLTLNFSTSALFSESALKYLEWAVSEQRNSDDVELHNLLILLYAQFRPMKLHEYLVKCGVDKTAIPYDLDFATRTSEQYKLDKSTVHLFCVSELFSEAVELALKRFDEDGIDLAKECAHMMDPDEDDSIMGLEPMYSVEQRRRIWLKIGSFLSFNVQMRVILHSVKIQVELQQAMNDATLTAKEIREKTQRLRNRYVTVIKAGDLCARCDRSLVGRPFYAHTCRHFFHRECLENAMMPYLNEELKTRLSDLVAMEKRLLSQLQAADLVSPASDNFYAGVIYFVSSAINEILGSDCPFCGINAIELIDKPFFTDEEFLADRDSWQID
uniref:Vacuolar protein sorting-associated protein 18 homolog n=1 Tax=Angiostrongylus costaricensis TaxID=334426 RepID=A0A0R3PK95_ANGCS